MTEPKSLRSKALALIARREYSRHELQRKLGDADRAEVDAVLDDFASRGWLSDSRYAEQYVRQHAARFGTQRLTAELRQRGVTDDTIVQALAEIPAEDSELSRARLLWQKKFGQVASDAKESARQARFLQSRGFGFDIIKRVIKGLDEDA